MAKKSKGQAASAVVEAPAASAEVAPPSGDVKGDALAVVVRDSTLESTSAAQLEAAFRPWYVAAREWDAKAKAIVVTSADQKDLMLKARESRLALRKVRVEVEHKRVELKADSLKRSQAIDGIARLITREIEPIEEHLAAQEEFVERAEKKRRAQLAAERGPALVELGADPTAYGDLGSLSDQAWADVLTGARATRDARAKREKEEAEAVERERVERAAREKALREENEKLRRERDAQAKKDAAERKRLDEERAAAQRKADEERRAREAAERKLRDEREAAERREREERAVEAKRRADEEEARREAEQAPDRVKLLALAAAVRALEVPELRTERGKTARTWIVADVEAFARRIESALPVPARRKL